MRGAGRRRDCQPGGTGHDVRDRDTGVRRPIRPGDIAILFRTRETHREFEQALERRGIPAYVYKGLGFFDADEIKDVLALLRYLADPTSDLRAAAVLRSGFGRVSDEGLRRLAPGLRSRRASTHQVGLPARCGLTSSQSLRTLDDEDRIALDLARRSLQRWCSLVDRMPPAELLDLILDESAYAIELRGARVGPTPVKTSRRSAPSSAGSRTGATRRMARIADHLDRLAVGDEPNAVIDAFDAVSLMTIHAAKGLEFPVVFIVNAARGTGNRRDVIRIAGSADDDDISVAVGDYRSEADEDAAAREREETKRLFYVALTRARDRVYLSTALKDGRVQPGRGSLAEVWPSSLLDAFVTRVRRRGSRRLERRAGVVHRFRVVAGSPTTAATGLADRQVDVEPSFASDFEPVAEETPIRRSVASVVASVRSAAEPEHSGQHYGQHSGAGSDLLVGLLVHRLLQRFGMTAVVDDAALASTVETLLQRERHAEAATDPETTMRDHRAIPGAERAQRIADAVRSGRGLSRSAVQLLRGWMHRARRHRLSHSSGGRIRAHPGIQDRPPARRTSAAGGVIQARSRGRLSGRARAVDVVYAMNATDRLIAML